MEVTLKVPKLRRLPFETAIIERYRRREAPMEEALLEMYLAGVPVRRVEAITEALWGMRRSPGAVSRLNHKIYADIEGWRNRQIVGSSPCQGEPNFPRFLLTGQVSTLMSRRSKPCR